MRIGAGDFWSAGQAKQRVWMRWSTIALIALGGLPLVSAEGAGAPGRYRADWESLKAHQAPEWFLDAKFGFYTHWGPVTVGAEDGPSGVQWYGRSMYLSNSPTFKYHREKYGDQRTFGYKDIASLFKPEKFDAGAWAELFAAAGARFAGPVVIHHDNYAMWDSQFTEWDSMDKSPQRDFTAELEKAIRRRGLKFIATFHHAFAWEYFEPAYQFDAADGKFAGLYCEPHKPGAPPSQAYLDRWLGMVNEVVQKYEPDLTWFDFGLGKLIPAEYQQRMFADYYNWAAAKGRTVGVAHKHWNIHEHTGIIDFERGRENRVTPYPWLTDTSLGPWFHQKSEKFKSVDDLVDVLVDIVSKNGCMLLNVGPQADGSIPTEGQALLRGIGQWLKTNGEAIYATRPWLVYGEGSTRQEKSGGFSEHADKSFTSEDIRFTRSKDGQAFYAIVLGWPNGPLTVKSLRVAGAAPDAQVRLLGSDGSVRHRLNGTKQLVIEPPANRAGDHAFAFKLTGFEIELHPDARFSLPDAQVIEPGKALIEGTKICLQDKGGRPNLGCWDDASERLHWLVWIRQAGTFAVRGEFSSAYADSSLRISLGGQSKIVPVPQTQGWFKPVFVDLGRFKFDRPGVYQLTLEPADAKSWRAVNVWQLQLAPWP